MIVALAGYFLHQFLFQNIKTDQTVFHAFGLNNILTSSQRMIDKELDNFYGSGPYIYDLT